MKNYQFIARDGATYFEYGNEMWSFTDFTVKYGLSNRKRSCVAIVRFFNLTKDSRTNVRVTVNDI